MLARFDRWEKNRDSVTVKGAAGRLTVTSPLAGVLRLCLCTPGMRGEKIPWACEFPSASRPLSVTEKPGGITVAAEAARCEITLAPFAWTFTGDGGELLTARACWIGEERRWVEDPHPRPLFETGEEGAPALTTVLDGRLLGHGVTLVMDASHSQHYYGLGERSGWLDRRGRRYTNWASDVSPILPTTDALYQAIPFLAHLDTGRAVGLLVDESWRSVFDIAATDPACVSVRAEGPSLDVYVIAGPAPAAVLERYAALTGRPPLPPLWALGSHQSRWSYSTDAEVRELVDTFREKRLPLDVVHLDIDYMDGFKVFTWDPARFPDPARLANDLGEQGVRLVAISEPSLKPEAGYRPYEEADAGGFLVRGARGDVFQGEVWTTPAVFVDFLKPEARAWWGTLFRDILDAGISGIWDDMNEPSVRGTPGRTLPLDARHGARPHLEVHNVYGLHHARATWEGLRALRPRDRPFVISRSGYAGIQRYAAVWTGDNSSWWEHLEGSIPMLLNLGLSGVPFTGADIGGFHGNTNGELLARWYQVGAFYPLMRNHSIRGSRRQEPWAFGEETEAVIRTALEMRYALLPYLYTLMEDAATRGLPPMRPVFLHYPDDAETYTLSDQFLFGPDLLVAPALRPGMTHRAAYFPHGHWADWWTGTVTAGPSWSVVETPLDRVPLFLRAGGAVPTAPPRLHTPERAVWEELEWRIFPEPSSVDSHASGTPGTRHDVLASGRLYEDDGKTPLDLRPAHRLSVLTVRADGPRLRVSVTSEGPLAQDTRSMRVRVYGLDLPRGAARSAAQAELDTATHTRVVPFPPGGADIVLVR
jgi:alpha-glucosidase